MPKVRRQKRAARVSPSHLSQGKQDPKCAPNQPSSGESESSKIKVNCMKLVTEFRKVCIAQAAAHPECKTNAVWMAKYMRNQFKFFGLKAPMRRKLQKELITTYKDTLTDRRLLLQLVPLLWEQEEREFQCFGVDLLHQYRKEILGSSSEEEFKEATTCVEQLIIRKSWWDTVDAISYPGIIYYYDLLCPALPFSLKGCYDVSFLGVPTNRDYSIKHEVA